MTQMFTEKVFDNYKTFEYELAGRKLIVENGKNLNPTDAMDKYGSDKPDIRFSMELVNVSDVVKDSEFVVFKGALENGGSVRGINAKGQAEMPRKKIDALVEFAKGYGAKGLAYLAVLPDGTYKSSFAKFMTEDEMADNASPELRSKKALIETFIAGINDVSDVMIEWRNYVAEEKEKQLVAIITEENLKEEETRKFIDTAFRDGSVKTTGTDIDKLMPPMSRFGGGNRAEKKQGVIAKLLSFFERFFGIG